MVRVKICGIQSAADIAACVKAGADALGFIFAESPRRLTLAQAAALAPLVPPFVAKVGVFADNSRALIQAALERCGLDVLQFAGDEPAEFCGSFGTPTIVVARNATDAWRYTLRDLRRARAAALMIDGQDGSRRGGTGAAVEHALGRAARRQSPLPFILAGGLRPSNVADAVRAVRPWAVDVRSGVERAGRKDATLIRQFIAAAKGVQL